MRPAARVAFRPVSERLEGKTRNPYADVRGLVTVSVGCLIDPISLALTLRWMIGARRATEAEVRRDWQAIKDLGKTWEKPGTAKAWTAPRQESLTEIRLTDAGVDALMAKRLDANIAYLRKQYAEWDSYSADAHLAILLTAWALGAAFDQTKPPRPALVKAIRERNWLAARVHSHLNEANNKGVVDRNEAIVRCFQNAAVVEEHGLDPEVLHWPAAVIPPVTITGDTSEPTA